MVMSIISDNLSRSTGTRRIKIYPTISTLTPSAPNNNKVRSTTNLTTLMKSVPQIGGIISIFPPGIKGNWMSYFINRSHLFPTRKRHLYKLGIYQERSFLLLAIYFSMRRKVYTRIRETGEENNEDDEKEAVNYTQGKESITGASIGI